VLYSPEEIRIHAAYACEISVIAAHLAGIGYEYFNHICVTYENSTNAEEKSCLIPICILPETSLVKKEGGVMQTDGLPSSTTYRNSLTVEKSDSQNGVADDVETEAARNGEDDSNESTGLSKGKRSRSLSSIGDNSDKPNGRMKLSNLIHDTTPISKRQKLDKSPESDQESPNCLKGVHEALALLKKGSVCLEYLESMWNDLQRLAHNNSLSLNDWEDELHRAIEFFNLPFDIYNSIILMRSDIALSAASVPGNLAKALKLSQTLCDRIEVQRSKEKAAVLTSSVQELDIPFMLAFRVLYNIGIIYLLVGNIQVTNQKAHVQQFVPIDIMPF
jgi:hypothetical protein